MFAGSESAVRDAQELVQGRQLDAGTPARLAGIMREIGFGLADEAMMTPASSAVRVLTRLGHQRVMVLGGPGLADPLREAVAIAAEDSQRNRTLGRLGAGLLPPGEPTLGPLEGPEEWIEVPAGAFAMGARQGRFAYDNEQPRHTVETPAFRIARRPVSCGSWMRFSEDGGYERPEWWSPEGWAFKQEHGIAPHPAVSASQPQAPACHVSFYEADAFARAHGARLPTEAEWERAATAGVLAAVGQVWEWTQTRFHGYPGFVAHPYREYSEVFFGESYCVLRGGSWATAPRVASLSFRNWDLPVRRQIFAGLRLAGDAS